MPEVLEPSSIPSLLVAEYGFCPKYAIQSGDTIFQLAEKLNVTTGACAPRWPLPALLLLAGGTCTCQHVAPLSASNALPLHCPEGLSSHPQSRPGAVNCRRAPTNRTPPAAAPHRCLAEALTEAATGCGADLSLLQIDQEICLPGYNSTICTHVLETGELWRRSRCK